VTHRTRPTHRSNARYSWAVATFSAISALERPRTARGALCGALAAAVWAFAQPLDKLVFKSSYDDVELLGRGLTGGELWYPLGFAVHVVNGALFGAVYTNVAPSLPLPPFARGPALALAEHLAFWPLGGLSDRLHPARDELPTLAGNRRAFGQATWRHLLFGIVLGELDRWLKAASEPTSADAESAYSSNGRGSLEDAMPARPTS
jgi:hypothetical protein